MNNVQETCCDLCQNLSEAQAGEGRTSPQTQEDDCRALAKKQGFEIVAVIKDLKKYRNAKGKLVEPAGDKLDRPGFQKLLAMARSGEIDVIVAWHLSRLVRGHSPIDELYQLHKEIPELEILLDQSGFDWHHFGLLGSVAHMEREDQKARLRRARLEAARRGVRQGGPPPFGYERDAAGAVVPCPDEVSALLRLNELYASGATHKRILATLDAEKLLPRSGRKWARGSLIGILANAANYNSGSFPFNFGGERHESVFDQILPDELYERVAARQKVGRGYRARTAHATLPALCRKLLYDGCGVHREWTMVLQWRGKPAGSVYRCPVRKNHYQEGVKETHTGSIGMRKMDRFVWDAVTERYFEPERVIAQINAEVEAIQSGQTDYDAELAKIDKVLGAHDGKRQEYLRLYRADKISQEDLELMLDEMKLERIVHQRNRRDIVAKQKQGEAGVGWAKQAEQVLIELLEKSFYLQADLSELTEDDDGNLSAVPVITPETKGLARTVDETILIPGEAVAEALGAAYYRDRHDLDWIAATQYAQYVARKAIVDTFIKKVNVRGHDPQPEWIEWRDLAEAADEIAMLPVLVGLSTSVQ